MTTISLASLLTVESQEDHETKILADLQSAGFPVTDWSDGGIAKTLVATEASANAVFSVNQMLIARGGYLSTASQAGDSWLTLLAAERYQNTRYEATKTVGRVSVYCDAANGPYTLTAGLLRFTDAVGHRYVNTTTGTLSSGTSMDLLVEAESGGEDYNVANDVIDTLETGLSGVGYALGTGVIKSNSSAPTVSYTGLWHASNEADVQVKIIVGGSRGTATFQWSSNGGGTWSATQTTAATYAVPGSESLVIAFATGTYVAGDIYYWTDNCDSFNPGPGGTWITVSGSDEESNERLQRRCQTRWATLGYGQNDDWFEYYATTGHDYADSVTRARVETMAPYTTAAKYTYDATELTVGGAPADQTMTRFIVEIDAGGARGVATFQWSDDDGASYTPGVTTGTAVPLGSTGCAISFADATYTIGQKWRFTGCYGGVLVTIATSTGGASSTIVDAVQAWFESKTMDRVLVESAIEEAVNITLNVTAPTSVQATLQTQAEDAIDALFEDRDLGQPLYRAELIAAVMGVGARNVEVASPLVDLACGTRTVLTLGTLTLNVVWV
ncbi:MAG: hypothetical protein EOM24_07325 [Chloroflexia bacterium]|nr:hypothetical protein [Chloroflexia bacterium]